jgi:N-acetyl-alpha-D-glucosaminyl L-malate synthase BshA
MRIGILCLSSCGGSSRVATNLACELAAKGHRIHLFSRNRLFFDPVARSGISVHTLLNSAHEPASDHSMPSNWAPADHEKFLALLLEVLNSEPLDVLHYHYAVPFAALAAKVREQLGSKAPVMVGTLHGTDVTIHGRNSNSRDQLRSALCTADSLTTVSRHHSQLAARVFDLDTRPQVIPNFIDPSQFKPKSDFADPKNVRSRPTLVHLSNFRPVKDTLAVAKVYRALRERVPASLWLIGEGPDLEAVRDYIDRHRVPDVRIWGKQEHVADLLTQTDLMLITSLSESFCLAVLEAMACGAAVLATAVGGLPELVTEDAGYLFPTDDRQAAVNFAESLLTNPVRLSAMRKAARLRALEFSVDKIVPSYESLYRELINSSLARQPEEPCLQIAQA